MKTRTLRRTGLQVSEIGLGCGGKFGFTETSEEAAEKILNHAIENGVNFFDTGSNYGQGLSEVSFVLDHEGVSTAIAATVNPQHLNENIVTLSLNKLDQSLNQRIQKS
jgi:aryl-alcohol dehydrogenase-like predicted oxidoreductase